MLKRAHSTSLIEKDITILNSQTMAARVSRGEIPPDYTVIRVNHLYKEVNFV